MNDLENRRMILGNFYRAIVGTTEALVNRDAEDREIHDEDGHGGEERSPDVDCPICLADPDNAEWFAERADALRSYKGRPFPREDAVMKSGERLMEKAELLNL